MGTHSWVIFQSPALDSGLQFSPFLALWADTLLSRAVFSFFDGELGTNCKVGRKSSAGVWRPGLEEMFKDWVGWVCLIGERERKQGILGTTIGDSVLLSGCKELQVRTLNCFRNCFCFHRRHPFDVDSTGGHDIHFLPLFIGPVFMECYVLAVTMQGWTKQTWSLSFESLKLFSKQINIELQIDVYIERKEEATVSCVLIGELFYVFGTHPALHTL